MRRGEIWLVDFEPVLGSEADKSRPAVIVSNDFANQHASAVGFGTLTVVPVTSSLARVLDFQVELAAKETGLKRDSKAQAEQIRSVDVRRLQRRLGRLTPSLSLALDRALKLHLDLA